MLMTNHYLYVVYLPVGLLAAVAPGPSILLVVSHGVEAEVKQKIALIAGLFLGVLVIASLAVAGVGYWLLQHSDLLFAFKLIGAILLIYMGVKCWFKSTTHNSLDHSNKSNKKPFLLGFITTFGNPKIAAFYFIVLPQFISQTTGHLLSQYAFLATTQVTFKALSLICYTLAAVYLKKMLDSHFTAHKLNRITAIVYVIVAGLLLCAI